MEICVSLVGTQDKFDSFENGDTVVVRKQGFGKIEETNLFFNH